MEDYAEIVKYGGIAFRLEVWETNKGPELGYVKWQISRLEDKCWVHQTSPVITLWDKAISDGRSMLHSLMFEHTGIAF